MLSSMGLVSVHRTLHLLLLSRLISRCSPGVTHHYILFVCLFVVTQCLCFVVAVIVVAVLSSVLHALNRSTVVFLVLAYCFTCS